MIRETIITTVSILCFLTINTNITAQSKGAQKLEKQEKEAFQKLVNDDKAMGKMVKETGYVTGNYEKKHNIKNNYCTAEDYKIPKKSRDLIILHR